MSDSYKARKEAFVSDLSGGPLHEINLVTLVAPVSPFLLCSVRTPCLLTMFPPKAAALLWSSLQARQSFFTPYGPVALITDWLLNVGAILFAITAYSSAPLLLDILLISPALIVLLLPASKDARKGPKHLSFTG